MESTRPRVRRETEYNNLRLTTRHFRSGRPAHYAKHTRSQNPAVLCERRCYLLAPPSLAVVRGFSRRGPPAGGGPKEVSRAAADSLIRPSDSPKAGARTAPRRREIYEPRTTTKPLPTPSGRPDNKGIGPSINPQKREFVKKFSMISWAKILKLRGPCTDLTRKPRQIGLTLRPYCIATVSETGNSPSTRAPRAPADATGGV